MALNFELGLLQRINLNHLITFLVVADATSFRGAAVALNVSQSALSVQIRKLEDAVGVTLFERTTRSVTLTPEGKRVLALATRLAEETSLIARSLREEANLQKRSTRLAAIPHAAHVAQPLLREFAREHGDLEVLLEVKPTSKIVASLVRDGAADIGIMYLPAQATDLECVELLRDRFMAIVPTSLAELEGRRWISLAELSRYPFLLQPPGSIVRTVLDAHFKAQKVTIDLLIELRPADGLVALVSAGLGVAVIPGGTTKFLNLEGCRLLELSDFVSPPFVLAQNWRRADLPATAMLHGYLSDNLGAELKRLVFHQPGAT